MRSSLLTLALSGAVLVTVASGCANMATTGGNPNAGYGSNTPLPGSATPAYSANEHLAKRVMASLEADARIGAKSLTVKVIDGVVELGGNADTVGARNLALETARRVPGVRTVVNNMTLN